MKLLAALVMLLATATAHAQAQTTITLLPPVEHIDDNALTKIVRVPRLILNPSEQRELVIAHRDERVGIALDIVGIGGMIAGTAFFVPLAVPDRNGGIGQDQAIAAGVVTTALGAAILGVGIHMYRRGAIRELAAIDRAFKRGTLRLAF